MVDTLKKQCKFSDFNKVNEVLRLIRKWLTVIVQDGN